MDMVHELSPSNGVHRLQTLGENLLTTLPDGSLGRRGAIHATSRNDMHVSCQSRRFFSRKTKNLVSRPETSFFIRAASFFATLEARGGGAIRSRRWSDLPQ
jgi:hypothetical protein